MPGNSTPQNSTYEQRLVQRLLAPKPLPSMVVLVGEPVFRLCEHVNRQCEQPDFSAATPMVTKTESVERYIEASKAVERNIANCVMCLDLPVPTPDVSQLLGLACRASPRLLLVEHTTGDSDESLLDDEQFFAFGFRVVEKIDAGGRRGVLYAYSLSDYKQAPDWLNARFWAHPERFDLQE